MIYANYTESIISLNELDFIQRRHFTSYKKDRLSGILRLRCLNLIENHMDIGKLFISREIICSVTKITVRLMRIKKRLLFQHSFPKQQTFQRNFKQIYKYTMRNLVYDSTYSYPIKASTIFSCLTSWKFPWPRHPLEPEPKVIKMPRSVTQAANRSPQHILATFTPPWPSNSRGMKVENWASDIPGSCTV